MSGNESRRSTTERVSATCAAKSTFDGKPFLIFEMNFFPSLPKMYFGLDLLPTTTEAQAEALADHINLISSGIFALTVP